MRSGLLWLALFAVPLSGCATSPIPKSVRKAVAPDLPFQAVLQDPEAHKGKKVLWGGQVLDIKNEADRTTLHLLQTPVDSAGRPLSADESQGRFVAVFDRYLDQAVYQQGRKVTVFGSVQGQRAESLGEGSITYKYPLIQGEEIYLWPRTRRGYTPYVPGYDPYWDGYYGPRWGTRFGVGFSL